MIATPIRRVALISNVDVSTFPHWEPLVFLSQSKMRSIRNSSNLLHPCNNLIHLTHLHTDYSSPYLGKRKDSALQTPHHHTSFVLLPTLTLTTVLKIHTNTTVTIPSSKSVVFLPINSFPLAHCNYKPGMSYPLQVLFSSLDARELFTIVDTSHHQTQ